jgi:hypothetical protein
VRLLDPARFYLHALRRPPPDGDATPHAAPQNL